MNNWCGARAGAVGLSPTCCGRPVRAPRRCQAEATPRRSRTIFARFLERHRLAVMPRNHDRPGDDMTLMDPARTALAHDARRSRELQPLAAARAAGQA
jgi:hypothetical protein